MQYMISMKHIDIRKYIDDIFNPHDVWLFFAIGERVQTGTQIYRQRRVQQFYWNVDGLRGTPVHTPG